MFVLLHLAIVLAQTPDPYVALRALDYDTAIAHFQTAIAAAPERTSLRKDLAYTYLKIGENDLARDQFAVAMRLDPADTHVALEFAFLSYESRQQALARRIFDRIRKSGNTVAEQAFRNIDAPLAAGIERWKKALAVGGSNFSSHFELAGLAEQRDELALAAEHYEKAWRLLPERRSVLVDLGRVWKALGRADDSTAALLAASRGGEPRAAEMARELLPARYPFVPEFRRALQLDPDNVELRRELAYLLLRMENQPEAEAEFASLAPRDLLAATQLGFLLWARGDRSLAQPHFDRVLASDDDELANRVRAVLRMPQVLRARPAPQPQSIDAKIMAERSIKAGYMKDALKYLEAAHEADPGDFNVMLDLGWTLNNLQQDRRAYQWFGLARKSSDPRIAAEAGRAWKNLRPSAERVNISGWLFPMYSTRWNAAFSYGQTRLEWRAGLPIRPYLSARLVGDSAMFLTQALSERAVIVSIGLTTTTWHGARAWFEAGNAIGYSTGRMLPDYRGGLAYGRAWRQIADTTVDAIYVSRFNKDFLVYNQTRVGRLAGPVQLYWNVNITVDARRESWANFAETGPGLRMPLVQSTWFSLNLLRGAYLLEHSRPNFTDFRAGLWYAFTY
jgi:tetratricopeptide (TPR) repeat protein